MKTNRYITYFIQKALEIHGRDENRGLCISYLSQPPSIFEITPYSRAEDGAPRFLRYPPPDPETMKSYGEHLGIYFDNSLEKEGELILLSDHGRVMFGVHKALNREHIRVMPGARKFLVKQIMHEGDSYILSHLGSGFGW